MAIAARSPSPADLSAARQIATAEPMAMANKPHALHFDGIVFPRIML
jgi:hypothetical protein